MQVKWLIRRRPATVREVTSAAATLSPAPAAPGGTRVSGHDVQRWLVHLLTPGSDAYASNQFRAPQHFFRWLAEEEQLPDLMTRLRA